MRDRSARARPSHSRRRCAPPPRHRNFILVDLQDGAAAAEAADDFPTHPDPADRSSATDLQIGEAVLCPTADDERLTSVPCVPQPLMTHVSAARTPSLAHFPTVAIAVCGFLDARSRFTVSTLLRLKHVQAATVRSFVTVFKASDSADMDLLTVLKPGLKLHPSVENLTKTSNAITAAAVRGHVNVLQWWWDILPRRLENHVYSAPSRTIMPPSPVPGRALAVPKTRRMAPAAPPPPQQQLGDPHIVSQKDEWVKVLLTADALDGASANGHTDVLLWWKASGWKMLYTTKAVDQASAAGHVETLQWWKASGLAPPYSKDAMDDASERRQLAVLQWWKDSGLALKYSARSLDTASRHRHFDVLDWWKDSGLELKYTVVSMDHAHLSGNTAVLKWWRESGLELKFSKWVVDVDLSNLKI